MNSSAFHSKRACASRSEPQQVFHAEAGELGASSTTGDLKRGPSLTEALILAAIAVFAYFQWRKLEEDYGTV